MNSPMVLLLLLLLKTRRLHSAGTAGAAIEWEMTTVRGARRLHCICIVASYLSKRIIRPSKLVLLSKTNSEVSNILTSFRRSKATQTHIHTPTL
uniref:Secreted peptide n=1 Tax=Anopheles braziliensis TaxID=58242 RepID=A0A2M3ZLS7_9DIPT